MPIARFQLEDGRVARFEVPEGTTPEQATQMMQQHFQAEQKQSSPSWADLPGNIPASAGRMLSNMAQPILHPIETAKGLDNLVMGLGQKLIPGRQAQEQYPEAVGSALADRYGSGEAIKNTAITDPVGMLADASGVVGGGSALLRGAGKLAASPAMIQAGKTGGRIATATDPAVMAMKAPGAIAGKIIEPVVSNVVGTTTGAGAEALREAAKAGMKGGEAGATFQSHMRGSAPVQDIVDMAKDAVGAMRKDRSKAYTESMAQMGKDQTVLDFSPIDSAVLEAEKIGSFKGKSISPSTRGVWDEILNKVDEWGKLDPAQFHTAEGLDALKKSIGDIRDSTAYGTPSRVVADRVFNVVKGQIVKQAPEYAKTMKDYETASSLIGDIEKTLSVNPRANIDTTIRKLQSILRNNANTNYNRRAELAGNLVDNGAGEIMPALAGEALSSATPRGLQALGATGAGVTALATNPAAVAGLTFASPRLMGESAYYLGKAGKAMPNIPKNQSLAQALIRSGQAKEALSKEQEEKLIKQLMGK